MKSLRVRGLSFLCIKGCRQTRPSRAEHHLADRLLPVSHPQRVTHRELTHAWPELNVCVTQYLAGCIAHFQLSTFNFQLTLPYFGSSIFFSRSLRSRR